MYLWDRLSPQRVSKHVAESHFLPKMQWIQVNSRPGAMDEIHGQSMHVTSQTSGAALVGKLGVSLGPERRPSVTSCECLGWKWGQHPMVGRFIGVKTSFLNDITNRQIDFPMGTYRGVLSIILSSRHEPDPYRPTKLHGVRSCRNSPSGSTFLGYIYAIITSQLYPVISGL